MDMKRIAEFYNSNGIRCTTAYKGDGGPLIAGWGNHQYTYEEAWGVVESSSPRMTDGAPMDKVCHILDRNILIIDIDQHEGQADGWESLAKMEQEMGDVAMDDICKAWINSPSGGRHYIFSKPEWLDLPKKLNNYPAIDILTGSSKADGTLRAQCVVAAGSAHRSKEGVYEFGQDNPQIVEAPSQLMNLIMKEVASDKQRKPQTPVKSAPAPKSHDGQLAGDAFNKSQSGLHLLIGELQKANWTFREKQGYYEWRHPNASSGHEISGTIGNVSREGNFLFHPFTTSTVFEADECITIFKAYAIFCHAGDMTAAAKALYDLNFGDRQDLGPDLSKYDFSFVGLPGEPETVTTVTPSSFGQVVPTPEVEERSPAADVFADDEDVDVKLLPLDLIRDNFLLGDITKWIESRQEYPLPELAFSAALHIFGLATARRWRGGKNDMHSTHCNLYSLSIAPTGSGKEMPRQCVKEFVCEAGHEELSGIEKLSSAQGIEWQVCNDSSVLPLMPDEMGDLIKSMCSDKGSNHHAQIAHPLKQLFTSANSGICKLSSKVGEEPMTVRYPYVSLMGSATPGMFFNSLSAEKIEDGLLGRFVMFMGDLTEKMIREAAAREEEVRKPIPKKAIRGWKFLAGDVDGNNNMVMPQLSSIQLVGDGFSTGADAIETTVAINWKEIPRSKEALRLFKEHDMKIKLKNLKHNKNGEDVEKAIWARVNEKTAKFAMIFALSRYAYVTHEEPCVTEDDMRRAIDLSVSMARRFIASIKTLVHESETEEHELKFLKALKKKQGSNGGKAVGQSIMLRMQPLKTLKANGKDKHFIDLLEKSQMIDVIQPEAGGVSFRLTQAGLNKIQGNG